MPAPGPAVDALLDRLGNCRTCRWPSHEEVYAGLHDDLLAALNEAACGPLQTPGRGAERAAPSGPTASLPGATNGRLDQALVAAGWRRSRTHAAPPDRRGQGQLRRRGAGQGAPCRSRTTRTSPSQHSDEDNYVSRAGHKLAGALDAFPAVAVAGKRCLDAGASTGGFTDVLLRRGAAHVVAVDVGHGQLVPQLRNDPRVAVHEGLNVRYMAAG